MHLTPILWHALNHPPTLHPLFWLIRRRLTQQQVANSLQLTWVEKAALAYLALVTGLLIISSTRLLVVDTVLLGVLVVLLTLPLFGLALGLLRVTLFAGTYHGLIWAIHISELIVYERQKRTFELLCLFPAGALAGVWALTTGFLYRGSQFNNALRMHILVLRTIGLLAAFYLSGLLLRDSETFFHAAIITAFVLLGMYLDFIHATILAVQVGILSALHTTNPLDARLWSASGFLALQVLTYAFTLTIMMAPFPQLMPDIQPHWLALIVSGIMALALLYAVRAGLIWLLWRAILQRLNTHAQDLSDVFTPGQSHPGRISGWPQTGQELNAK